MPDLNPYPVMTREDQRSAIARACPDLFVRGTDNLWYFNSPDLGPVEWSFYDLNAAHEVEKMLLESEREAYTDYLCYITDPCYAAWFSCAHATAPQRYEAFLRVHKF